MGPYPAGSPECASCCSSGEPLSASPLESGRPRLRPSAEPDDHRALAFLPSIPIPFVGGKLWICGQTRVSVTEPERSTRCESSGPQWGRRDLTPHASRHVILSHACLPIPALPRPRIIAFGRRAVKMTFEIWLRTDFGARNQGAQPRACGRNLDLPQPSSTRLSARDDWRGGKSEWRSRTPRSGLRHLL